MGTRTSGSGERAGETDARKSRTALRPDPHYWVVDHAEDDAIAAVDFALAALEEAEYAVLDARLARMEADDLAAASGGSA